MDWLLVRDLCWVGWFKHELVPTRKRDVLCSAHQQHSRPPGQRLQVSQRNAHRASAHEYLQRFSPYRRPLACYFLVTVTSTLAFDAPSPQNINCCCRAVRVLPDCSRVCWRAPVWYTRLLNSGSARLPIAPSALHTPAPGFVQFEKLAARYRSFMCPALSTVKSPELTGNSVFVPAKNCEFRLVVCLGTALYCLYPCLYCPSRQVSALARVCFTRDDQARYMGTQAPILMACAKRISRHASEPNSSSQ